jgi:hypothetical protein
MKMVRVLCFLYSLFWQMQQGVLVISVSFPDVIGAFAPTVRTALVHAIPAFRIAKIIAFTHKTFAILIDAELDFYLSMPFHKLILFTSETLNMEWKQPRYSFLLCVNISFIRSH